MMILQLPVVFPTFSSTASSGYRHLLSQPPQIDEKSLYDNESMKTLQQKCKLMELTADIRDCNFLADDVRDRVIDDVQVKKVMDAVMENPSAPQQPLVVVISRQSIRRSSSSLHLSACPVD